MWAHENFRLSFLDSIIVNFLRNDNEKTFIYVCFSNITIAITTLRKHVRESRKICLLVCNAKFIYLKL
jgi:hypothetical protein